MIKEIFKRKEEIQIGDRFIESVPNLMPRFSGRPGQYSPVSWRDEVWTVVQLPDSEQLDFVIERETDGARKLVAILVGRKIITEVE